MQIDKKKRRLIQFAGLAPIAALGLPKEIRAATQPQRYSTPNGFHPDVEIALKASVTKHPILSGAKTKIWKFSGHLVNGPKNSIVENSGSYLGPTLNFRRGQKVRIRFYNDLPGECIIHWHGLHVPEHSDGHPRYAVSRGQQYLYEFEVKNRAGTYWYHSHTHGVTGQHVYFGLGGILLISDDEERQLSLPADSYDIPLVIQDRRFDENNQLLYANHMHDRMMGYLGDRILVNGRPNFVLPVATRAYRLRILNLSNSRIYKLAWSNAEPVTVIGSDGGLLERPEQYPYITLGPAERADVWVNFGGARIGEEIYLRSLAFHGTMPMMAGMYGGMRQRRGMMSGAGNGMRGGMGRGMRNDQHRAMSSTGLANGAEFSVLRIVVNRTAREKDTIPDRLTTIHPYRPQQAINANAPKSIRLSMRPMSPNLNGRSFSMHDAAPDETMELGNMYLIEFVNRGHAMRGMMMAHPMHIHGQQFQIIKREVATGYEDGYASLSKGFLNSGWKDVVLVMPGEKVSLLKRFDDYTGLYLYHCHNLEHEDLDMMRNFRVLKQGVTRSMG